MPFTRTLILTTALAASAAQGQISIGAHFIGGGGSSANGTLVVIGSIGPCDGSALSNGPLVIAGGFWSAGGSGGTPCYANCDGSTGNPVLTPNDFQCFLNAYAAAQTSANCDGSTGNPTLTPNDFQCFLNAYAAGCS